MAVVGFRGACRHKGEMRELPENQKGGRENARTAAKDCTSGAYTSGAYIVQVLHAVGMGKNASKPKNSECSKRTQVAVQTSLHYHTAQGLQEEYSNGAQTVEMMQENKVKKTRKDAEELQKNWRIARRAHPYSNEMQNTQIRKKNTTNCTKGQTHNMQKHAGIVDRILGNVRNSAKKTMQHLQMAHRTM